MDILESIIPDEVILPVAYPLVTSYPVIANMLSITAYYEETIPWFCNHFTQIYAHPEGKTISNFTDDYFDICPFLNINKIERNLLPNWIDLLTFITHNIARGYYFHLTLDQYYIPVSNNYKKNHNSHSTFIYGYNNINEEFYIADFYKNFKYSYEKISFLDFQQAYSDYNYNCYKKYIILLKYEKVRYEFDLERVKNAIEDYVSCMDRTNRFYTRFSAYTKDNIYGLDYYTYAIKCIENLLLDIRPFYVIMDHKKAMLEKIKYMGEYNYLNNANYLYEKYKEIEQAASVNKQLILKFRFNNNKELLDNAIKRYRTMAENEEKLLYVMLKNIKS